MLVLSRKESECICIGDDIEIVIHQIRATRVCLGISAPPEVAVLRKEILNKERSVASTDE